MTVVVEKSEHAFPHDGEHAPCHVEASRATGEDANRIAVAGWAFLHNGPH
jgi:hypothetical protein